MDAILDNDKHTQPGMGMDSQSMPSAKPKDGDDKNESSDAYQAECAFVKRWQECIRESKAHWEPDFQRMRENMEFVAGLQYHSQRKMDHNRYIANWTLRSINQKVATLYAKNPTVEAVKRKRLNYELWDGKIESLVEAAGHAMQSAQQMGFVPPEVVALMNDFQRGRTIEQVIDRVALTLEKLYQYEMDSQEPDFKTQAKQLVRRASVCGVGYIRVSFCRNYETNDLTQSETRQSVVERMLRAKRIMDQISEGKLDPTDPEIETLKNLVLSFSMAPDDTENVSVKERLVFDFPQATSIIPDKRCRNLRGFVGAHWIAEEFIYPLEFINAMFEKDIKPGGSLKHYSPDGKPMDQDALKDSGKDDPTSKPQVCLWQVSDLDTKTTFVICDGYKHFVMEPETVTPATKSFWTTFPLTFNDVETEAGCRASIFPPSDVQLMKSMQQEWNRTRQALRQQRKANAPKYMCPKGTLSEADKDKIENAEDNQVIELENLPPGSDPAKVIVPLQTAAIDPAVYDTKPLAEDALLVTGQQEANIGPAQPNVTATVGTIAEQSRQTVASSNIDDLDDCLSAVARCGGEMLLREMSRETVRRIVGDGSAWPEQGREDFLNQIELTIVASSSGRPNKAMEIANFERIAPLLLQAGANPQAIIREAIKRLDDRLDPTEFFPIPGLNGGGVVTPPPGMQPGGPPSNGRSGSPPGNRTRAASRGQQQMLPAGLPHAMLPGGAPMQRSTSNNK